MFIVHAVAAAFKAARAEIFGRGHRASGKLAPDKAGVSAERRAATRSEIPNDWYRFPPF